MASELQGILSDAAASRTKLLQPPPPPAVKKNPAKKQFVRKMRDHVLPPYVEANFRTMQFVMTRAPKLDDFPRERLYKRESIDLLFRHYYKNRRA